MFTPFTISYGRQVYRFRRWIIFFWIVLTLSSMFWAGRVTDVLRNSGYTMSGSESGLVDQILASRGHPLANPLLITFQSESALVSDQAYQQQVQAVTERVKTFKHVTGITGGGIGADLRTTFLNVRFDTDKETVTQYIPALRQWLSGTTTGPAHVYLTGYAPVTDEFHSYVRKDSEFAETVSLFFVLIALLLIFKAVVAALLPIILAGMALTTTFAILYGIALHVEMNILAFNLISLIGLGLCIDYSLLLIRRFREELARGYAVPKAVEITVATAGEAIFHSGIIVMIGCAGLLLIGVQLMSSFGIGGMIVTGIAVCGALTLLPAILGVVGDGINALPLPFLMRQPERFCTAPLSSSFWQRLAHLVMKRPLHIILPVATLLLLSGLPALALNPGWSGSTLLPRESEARQGLAIFRAQYPLISQDPLLVLVKTPDNSSILTTNSLQRIHAISQWISTLPHVTNVVSLMWLPQVAGVDSQFPPERLVQLYSSGMYQTLPALRQLADFSTRGDITIIAVTIDSAPNQRVDPLLIEQLRSIGPDMKQDLQILVGGERVTDLDFTTALYGNFFRATLFFLIATYLLLLFTFRSLLLPLKAILMNILSISTAFGALVFVFQNNYFEGILGFTSPGFIDCFVPILMFYILFGLSMDYEVFLLFRMREEWLRTGDNRMAVARGLEKTGNTITQAALLLVIVSATFIFTSIIVNKELGLGITVSVLVDATLIRCLLVPAMMRLMGAWNWWLPGQKRSWKVRPAVAR